ncbi:LPS export ABC transporter periplasmic protein LptC [Aquicoccus sp. G2-2]|jgi:lipopolysaccharide export system protein LptC|uniref:LPS export ABC transporter periplasmic protein LptC n=1 Tax=Aquicoccus sp. G2-2 TaxID=3092120 RepID=UPI002ADFB278|nr:LPS export ABC transporter periplasmic protein LptC [Aquicoccus sp. G2-2]MEA1114655.1 LPS export ABC transporter periplasmic protein LptC [Aquicoccus sp. G2-2]
MAAGDDTYSRVVAWLKILLPLLALGLLATLFLFSRSIDPTSTIPFTTIDLTERARDEQVTNPQFAGATTKGDLIAFRAAKARPDPDDASRALATALDARIDLKSGNTITFSADHGSVDQQKDRAELDGNVVIKSSTGYRVTTKKLISGMKEIHAETPGPVNGEGPPGSFTAGRMLLTDHAAEGVPESDVHLLFTDGVKLIYDPSRKKD